MKTKAHEKRPGETSSIRVTLLTCLWLGGFTIVVGCLGWLLFNKNDGVQIVAAGSFLIGLVSGAKAYQTKNEVVKEGD